MGIHTSLYHVFLPYFIAQSLHLLFNHTNSSQPSADKPRVFGICNSACTLMLLLTPCASPSPSYRVLLHRVPFWQKQRKKAWDLGQQLAGARDFQLEQIFFLTSHPAEEKSALFLDHSKFLMWNIVLDQFKKTKKEKERRKRMNYFSASTNFF